MDGLASAAKSGVARDARDYLLALEEVLRSAGDARTVLASACAMLGQHLGVAAAGFVELDTDGVHGRVVTEWLSGAIPSMQGEHLVLKFGPTRLAPLRDGHQVVVSSLEGHPLIQEQEAKAAVRALGVEAFVECPLVVGGALRGWLYVSDTRPRDWSADHLQLLSETCRRLAHAHERARAEEQLRESQARLDAVLDQMPIGVILASIPDGDLLLYNRASAQIMGHDMVGETLAEYSAYGGIHPDGRRYAAHEYPTARAVLNGERVIAEPLRYLRPDGTIAYLSVSAAPVRSPAGDIAVCTFQDETRLHEANERLALLNHELNHRVKNMLATIQGIAAQTFGSAEEREAFVGRLQALGAAHDLLTNRPWAGELEDLVREALRPFLDDERVEIQGPAVRLEKAQAVPFALALHELATNAVKYGALSVPQGRVAVGWAVAGGEDRDLTFEWRESGGPPVAYPTRRGFGSRMLERSLASELRGRVRIDFDPAGVVCTVTARLTA